MPKMKTHKGTAKRFTFTGSGKLVSAMGQRGHFRRRKSTRLLQKLDRMQAVHETTVERVLRGLPYRKKHAR
ncbi:MAG: 50S ribosomal protein L35 [Roseiflexaceae bacterium]|jgi:large subunit ribosomal protein L35|nr:50S ribosomal protein L35 [Chloroflexota bacterium]